MHKINFDREKPTTPIDGKHFVIIKNYGVELNGKPRIKHFMDKLIVEAQKEPLHKYYAEKLSEIMHGDEEILNSFRVQNVLLADDGSVEILLKYEWLGSDTVWKIKVEHRYLHGNKNEVIATTVNVDKYQMAESLLGASTCQSLAILEGMTLFVNTLDDIREVCRLKGE